MARGGAIIAVVAVFLATAAPASAEPDPVAPDPTATVAAAEAAPGDDRARVMYQFGQRTRRFLGDDRDAYLQLADEYLGARRDVITFRSPTAE